jgi:prophage antirepressor-like protein
MSNTSALVPHLFEGHRIRVSTDQQGEAWIVVADACAALAESPMVWAMANRRDEEEHCLLEPSLGNVIREAYAVCSPAIHGEPATEAQVEFVKDVGPQLAAALRTIQ